MSERKLKITINDVAHRAKVSKTTVSRYLNGRYESMSEETKDTIQKVIEELDYRPSTIARSLKSKNTKVIGCVIADITNPFSSFIVKGMNDVCKEKGYQVLFVNTDNKREDEIEGIKSLMDHKLDGLIVNTSGYNDDYILSILNQGVPIVLADRCLKDKKKIDTVTSKNYTATFDCIRYLHKQGYSKVAFFSQELGEISIRQERFLGYMNGVEHFYRQNGKDAAYIIDSKDDREYINALYKLKKKNKEEKICIFAVNGVTLMKVITAMSKSGYMIGKDFGICGFDDWGWASLIPPGITTITQDSYQTGVKSAQILIDRIENGMTQRKKFVELPTKLVERGSTIPNNEK